MGEKVHLEQRREVRERSAEAPPELEVPEDRHGDERCPHFDLEGVGAGTDEGVDLEVLLQRPEQRLDPPRALLD